MTRVNSAGPSIFSDEQLGITSTQVNGAGRVYSTYDPVTGQPIQRQTVSGSTVHANLGFAFGDNSNLSKRMDYGQGLTEHQLGSNSLILSDAGALLAKLSYDAYGKRRGANWSGAPTETEMGTVANASREGYTGHTMLDNMGLIHMNGRVQDPLLGRFLSADPYVSDPDNTQNYNRYSYVYNNPLTYTDPSGFVVSDTGCGQVDDGVTVCGDGGGNDNDWDWHLRDLPGGNGDSYYDNYDNSNNTQQQTFQTFQENGEAATCETGQACGGGPSLEDCEEAGTPELCRGNRAIDKVHTKANKVMRTGEQVVSEGASWYFGGKILSAALGRAVGWFKSALGMGEATKNLARLDEALKPGGKLIGTVRKGATEEIRTVTGQEFNQLRSQLMNMGAKQVEKPGYPGSWYELPSGGGFGVREAKSGQTLDFDLPGYLKGLKVHQQ